MKKAIISFVLAAIMLVAPTVIGFGASDAVVMTKQGLTVNGKTVTTQAYNINGNNYFKLRDVAAMVNGTKSQFDVGYDEQKHIVAVTKGTRYDAQGNENTTGEDLSATCVKSSQSVTVNGREVSMTAYNIGGNNYFKLRDLGMLLGFYVDYDAAAASVRISTPDSYDDAGWILGYRETILELRNLNREHTLETYKKDDAVSYQLYDIDKDDVPELFVHFGTVEADRYMKVYTYLNDTVKPLGKIFCGHTVLCSWPGENACALYWGHMGDSSISKITIVDGDMQVIEGVYNGKAGDDGYTPIGKIVPGAKELDIWRITIELPIVQYRDVLQIAQGYECPKWTDDSAVKADILDTVKNNGEMFGLCADEYGETGGYMRFNDYLQPGWADKYSKKPLTPSYYAWADVNCDGTVDCVMKLRHADDDTSSDSDVFIVISSQNGTVYAYSVTFFDGTALSNGVLVEDYDGDGDWDVAQRVMFSGVVGYLCSVELNSPASEVEWIKY
ncbi:MAG: hypothetical protein IKD89_05925 [Clostridia bacterium]|nr:hypothetical protein [Clostridia bacterium]